MKGAESAVKWKEVQGHARQLSGKTCKGSKVQIIPRTNRTYREIKEREGHRDRAAGLARRAYLQV